MAAASCPETLLTPSLQDLQLITRPDVRLEQAHVINLARRPDRWNRATGVLREDLGWDIPVVRHEAVDTSTWAVGGGPFETYVAPDAMGPIVRGVRETHRDLSRGAVGCALSHMSLWSMLLAHESWQTLLVFEDDVRWVHSQRLRAVEVETRINAVPRDWDMLLLGAIPKEIIAEGPHHVQLGFFHCTHAYVVHRAGLVRLMRGLLPLRKQIDSALSEKVPIDDLRIYCLKEHLFDQTWADSDVQTPMTGPAASY